MRVCTRALKWATAAEVGVDEDDASFEDEDYITLSSQLYLALVLMRKGKALTMIRNVSGNNGLEA